MPRIQQALRGYDKAMSTHFSEAGLRFLRGLKRNNDRDWFNERKATYEQEIKEPMLALINEVNEAMLRFAPDHVRSPAKTMMRIYRDIRFSPDKRPYKHHAGAWWARFGLEKTSGAGFYAHISGTEVHVAAGVFMPERDQLLAIRRHIVTDHARLRKALASRKLRGAGLMSVPGSPLTRAPKGFDGPPEAMDLILQREWGVGASFPAAMALTPLFARDLARLFEHAAPLVDLLNEPLLRSLRRPSFVPLPL